MAAIFAGAPAQGLARALSSKESTQVKDGVAHELSRAVEGYVAAAVTFKNLNACGAKLFRRRQNIGRIGIPAQGDDGRMLKQQQHVSDASRLSHLDQRRLQAQRCLVVKRSELENMDQSNSQSLLGGTAGPLEIPNASSDCHTTLYFVFLLL